MQIAAATIQPPPFTAPMTVRLIPVKAEFSVQTPGRRSLRVAAYCRVSTNKDEQHLSFETQQTVYTDKIMTNPEWQMAKVYADKGISGTVAAKRPGFMQMITDCKAGKIDLILTKSVQRFARNTLDSLEYGRMLRAMGVGIIFETQGLDTRSMSDEMMFTMLAGMAQNESENISANVKWGIQRSHEKGRVHFNYKAFLGYRKGEDGQPEIVPEEALIVQSIYAEFLSGTSMRDIAVKLTTNCILTPTGTNVWSTATVRNILSNEKYCGDAILGKTFVENCLTHRVCVNRGERPMYYVENSHPAIIDRGTWNQTQEELTRRGAKRKVKQVGTTTEQGKYSSKFALTDLLICGECGTPYRRCTWSRNGQKKIVWRCISRLDYGTKYCKTSPTIEESVLHDAILNAMADYARTCPAGLDALKQHLGIGLTDTGIGEADPYAIQARIGEIMRTITELVAKEAEEGTPGMFTTQFDELFAEKQTLQEKLKQAQETSAYASAKQSRLDRIFSITDGIRNNPIEWNEQIVRQMIECVKVRGNEKLAIRFRTGVEMTMTMGDRDGWRQLRVF